jgi:hypothetical protein
MLEIVAVIIERTEHEGYWYSIGWQAIPFENAYIYRTKDMVNGNIFINDADRNYYLVR